MDYWPSARWKIGLLTGGVQHWVEPSGPLALIGAHPCCAARVDDKRVPPVAYIACSFEDSVEVWPVRPLAFDRWGVVDAHHELIVGSTHINLVHQTHPVWPRVSGGQAAPTSGVKKAPTGLHQEPLPQIMLEWGGKVRPKPLYRRVTIIGQDHPSTLRMYGMGMLRCDHAIIAVDGWLGLVNLSPGMVARAENLVTRLTTDTPPITIGRVTVSVDGKSAARPTAAPVASAVAENADVAPTSTTKTEPSEPPAAPTQPAEAPPPKKAAIGKELFPVTQTPADESPSAPIPAAKPSPQPSPVMPARATPEPATQPPLKRTPDAQATDVQAPVAQKPVAKAPVVQKPVAPASDVPGSDVQQRQAAAPVRPDPIARVAQPAKTPATVGSEQQAGAGSESLASQLTDRLISIDQDRSTHRRILMQSVYTAAFLVAGILLAWVIIAKILPMVGM